MRLPTAAELSRRPRLWAATMPGPTFSRGEKVIPRELRSTVCQRSSTQIRLKANRRRVHRSRDAAKRNCTAEFRNVMVAYASFAERPGFPGSGIRALWRQTAICSNPSGRTMVICRAKNPIPFTSHHRYHQACADRLKLGKIACKQQTPQTWRIVFRSLSISEAYPRTIGRRS